MPKWHNSNMECWYFHSTFFLFQNDYNTFSAIKKWKKENFPHFLWYVVYDKSAFCFLFTLDPWQDQGKLFVSLTSMPCFLQLWPEKFQNKTNGVTPRRWIRFCNPYLSKIITEWIGTEDWVLNTEKLAELRKVITII